MKKLAALTESERFLETKKCGIEPDEVTKFKAFTENKTVTLIKSIKNCEPFIGVSILFLCTSIILIGIMIYSYLKLKNNILPY